MIYLIAALALASNATRTMVRQQQGTTVSAVPCKTLICNSDSPAYSHVWFDGSQLRDTKKFAWSMTGTVPQVARSGKTPPGAGPFSDTAYYSRASPNALNFASGDFTVIVVAWVPNPSQNGVFIGNTAYPSTANGWWTQNNGRRSSITTGAGQYAMNSELAPLGEVSVFCSGRAGSNDVAQLNLGTFVSAARTYTPNTSDPTYLGRLIYSGNAYASTIYEILVSSSTPTADVCTAAAQAVKARLGITAW